MTTYNNRIAELCNDHGVLLDANGPEHISFMTKEPVTGTNTYVCAKEADAGVFFHFLLQLGMIEAYKVADQDKLDSEQRTSEMLKQVLGYCPYPADTEHTSVLRNAVALAKQRMADEHFVLDHEGEVRAAADMLVEAPALVRETFPTVTQDELVNQLILIAKPKIANSEQLDKLYRMISTCLGIAGFRDQEYPEVDTKDRSERPAYH